MTRCKLHDMALYVGKGAPLAAGAFITQCVEYIPNLFGIQVWRIDPPIPDHLASPSCYRDIVYDSSLTPIRYGDGEDEMLRIAGYPIGRKETA